MSDLDKDHQFRRVQAVGDEVMMHCRTADPFDRQLLDSFSDALRAFGDSITDSEFISKHETNYMVQVVFGLIDRIIHASSRQELQEIADTSIELELTMIEHVLSWAGAEDQAT